MNGGLSVIGVPAKMEQALSICTAEVIEYAVNRKYEYEVVLLSKLNYRYTQEDWTENVHGT